MFTGVFGGDADWLVVGVSGDNGLGRQLGRKEGIEADRMCRSQG